ncbi:hypothetical protein KUCAC02_017048, partial [Chaenocephalus aceratus]
MLKRVLRFHKQCYTSSGAGPSAESNENQKLCRDISTERHIAALRRDLQHPN